MQRVLAGVDRRARRRAGRRRVGRGEQQALVGEPVHVRRRVADRDAAAVEAGVHPADVVHQEDQDVGLLAGLLLERCELVARCLVLLGMRDDRVHVVGRLHVLEVHVLLGMAEAGSRRRPGRRAADVLGGFLGDGRDGSDRQRRDERGADGKWLHVGAKAPLWAAAAGTPAAIKSASTSGLPRFGRPRTLRPTI